jgi:hypothetical protein
MYVKKSPGCENFGDAVSSLLPYVYTVLESAKNVSGLRMLAAPTEVCVKDDPKFRTGYEERRDESPYLRREPYEGFFDEE